MGDSSARQIGFTGILLVVDILPTPSARDLDLLRSSRRARVGRTVVTVALSLVALLFFGLFATYMLRLRFGEPSSLQSQGEQLSRLRHQWSTSFADELQATSEWLEAHGTSTEVALFQGLSGVVIDSLLGSNSAMVPEEELTPFSRIFLSIHISLVRLLFFVIASFRLCLAVGLLAFVRGMVAWKPYRNSDALGQMGTGRVFYSGAYGTLEAVTNQGIPDKLTRGFACPQLSPLHEVKASRLWRVLSSENLVTRTTTALAQILVRNQTTAPYVALPGEEGRLAQSYTQTDLITNAAALLEEALRVHTTCAAGRGGDEGIPSGRDVLSDPDRPYPERVAVALRRVLTPALQSALAEIPAAEIATFVLAFESGKVLAHSYEGERWVRRSNFVHLSARAVLHSLVEYPQEFAPEARTRIRTALVYAARKSPFSPIRLPVDLDPSTLALRQWAEVLLACPHELSDVVTELEIVALVREAHTEWRKHFFNTTSESFRNLRTQGYATRTNLLFVPIGPLVAELRRVVQHESLDRMRALLPVLAAAQARVEGETLEDEGSVVPTFSFERVHPLPSEARIAALASMHAIQLTDLSDWLVLRYVLSSFGWLASRVGDYSVPESGVAFAVFQASPALAGANSFGRLGVSGMIALRGSKAREQLGSGWNGYFIEAERVTIAESDKEYERLLQGIEERVNSDEAEQGVLTTAEPER